MNKILPSLLGIKDLNELNMFLNIISDSDIEELHLDIMDGVFVENKCNNLDYIKTLNETGYISNVHLMVENPEEQINYAANLGADSITIHYEIDNFNNMLNLLLKLKKETGLKVGVSICPETDINALKPILNKIDIVLLMSVHPGRGGQNFMDIACDKIKKLRALSNSVRIIVDGGITDNTISKVFELGADSVVVGSYITKEISSSDKKIENLKKLI